ncbi:hypothetical protein EJ110_NYTH45764 [Nymphaea thermarum]|nr:hypothetical protein EJ110_NYTH45764 [Nymphaea thermarum]
MLKLINVVKANRIEKEMHEADVRYGDPHEEEGSQGEDVKFEEDVGVSLGTDKGKGIINRGGSLATTRKKRGASTISQRRGMSHGHTIGTGGGSVPTLRLSIGSGSIKNFFSTYTAAGAQPEIRTAMYSKVIIDTTDDAIRRWFYDASITINAANSYHSNGLKCLLIINCEKIINERWSGQFHRPLHAAAYYLNPATRYLPTFKKDTEVEYGMLDCIEILVSDYREQEVVHVSINKDDTCYGNVGRDHTSMQDILESRQIEAASARKHHTQFDPINHDNFDVLDSWVEEEPSTILDGDDLNFLNIEVAAKLFEGEARKQ